MTAYQGFAALYDRLMDDVDYDAWAAHYLRLMGVAPGDRVAELGCGTGEMTVRLAKAGISILGADLSPEMIAVAQEKARAWGVAAGFAVQDMTRLALPRPVKAVFCACDGVNYLCSLAQVCRCFARVHAALLPGGVFAFDISAPRKLRAMAGQLYGEDRQDMAYLWLNAWQEEARLLKMDLTFFVRQEGGLYRRIEERHVLRAHEAEELLQALRAAGFEDPAALSDFAQETWRPGDERIHFVARKPMKP